MVKLMSMTETTDNAYRIEAFADTKEDVTSGMTIEGFPANATVDAGSSIITANGDIALCKSDGTWNWVEE